MKYMIIGLFLLFAGNIYAQVRGTVKDSTGEAIPGANVFWMNTGQGVTTKEDGSFSIVKPSKSHMLIISFIGFQNDTIHVSSKNQQLDIVLRDGVELNEVNIVTRKLGTMKLRSSVMNEDMISSAELSRAACCLSICNDLINNICKLITKVSRNDCWRCLICTKSVIVTSRAC